MVVSSLMIRSAVANRRFWPTAMAQLASRTPATMEVMVAAWDRLKEMLHQVYLTLGGILAQIAEEEHHQ